MLSLTSRAIRHLLFLTNFIFVVSGVTLICVGVVIKAVYEKYEDFLTDKYFSSTSLLIATGSIMFLISFFGCCGAMKQNYCMIITFSVLLGCVFILELSAAITGYELSDQTEDLLAQSLNNSMRYYNDSGHRDVTVLWDTMQTQLECCGTRSFHDWQTYFGTGLPVTCCQPEFGAVGQFACTDSSAGLRQEGCLSALTMLIGDNAYSLAGVALSLALIQLLGIVFSCHLAKAIRAAAYETV